ncbi:MAG: hypothetical protein LBV41_08920 [Cytophagaceae bacterium]|jgi:hypothetical protein|nr:hypothetical protein [Cytophagaceae bacterium]
MKTSFFMIAVVLLVAGLTSCKEKPNNETGDLFFEISPNSKSQLIEKEVNGITFKFCLLNEQGQPATVFNEGENFSFYFSVTNNTEEKLFYVPEIVRSNDSFCKVFNAYNQDFGKPYIAGAINMIGIAAYMLDVNEIREFKQQWIDERDSWQWEHTHFKSSYREPLIRGNYYTIIKHKFEFMLDNGIKFYIDSVNLKINFQIK